MAESKHWAQRLFFRLTGEDVQHQCVVLAACQAQSSQSASLFLGSWLSPPLVYSLSVSSSAVCVCQAPSKHFYYPAESCTTSGWYTCIVLTKKHGQPERSPLKPKHLDHHPVVGCSLGYEPLLLSYFSWASREQGSSTPKINLSQRWFLSF